MILNIFKYYNNLFLEKQNKYKDYEEFQDKAFENNLEILWRGLDFYTDFATRLLNKEIIKLKNIKRYLTYKTHNNNIYHIKYWIKNSIKEYIIDWIKNSIKEYIIDLNIKNYEEDIFKNNLNYQLFF